MVSVESIQLGSIPCLIYLGHDITERKRTEEALRLAKFSIDRAADAVYWIDPQAKIQNVNEAANLMLGYSKDELCTMTVHDLNPDFHADMWPGFWAETQRRRTMMFETSHKTKNGRLIPVEVSVNYLCYEGKEYHCAFVRDITERKRAEAALIHSRNLLQSVIQTSPIRVFWKDRESRYLGCNQIFAKDAGATTPEHVIGMVDDDLAWEEQAELYRANDRQVMESGLPKLDFEEPQTTPDGNRLWLRTSKVPLRDEMNQVIGVLGVYEDITRRKIAEEALQASDAFTRAVLDSLSAHVCVLDREGVILKTNDTWEEFARRYVDDAFTLGDVGDNYLDRCRHTIADDASTRQAILKGIEAVLTGDQPSFSAEYQTVMPEVPRWFLMRVTQLKESKGAVISQTDISERVLMAQLLEQHILLLAEKRDELEFLTGKLIDAQEEERKRIARDLHDDFNQRLAALSLELESMERTPIALPEPVAGQLAGIRGQIGQLSDDLHDLAHRLHPSLLEHVGLEVVLRDHVAEFTKRTGLPVRFCARQAPRTLSQEIATNLFRVMQESLQNVSKHAQATHVTVRLNGSSKGIGLSVRDNGKGFDLESKNACAGGLGLVSMQERARGLGGFLRIHSLPRAGTKVCAWIPHVQEGDMKLPRVLMADDHSLILAGLRKLVEVECDVVGTVEDGRALIEAAQKLRPDLILLDISMPLLNGLEAARQLRILAPESKLIFLTMHASPTYATEAFQAGASGYLLKRSAASELSLAIRSVLQGQHYLTPLLTKDVLDSVLNLSTGERGKPVSPALTARQREVLQLVAEGRGTKVDRHDSQGVGENSGVP